MHDFIIAFPPLVVMRGAVAAVWLYEGLWCKILGRAKREAEVAARLPGIGAQFGPSLLKMIGIVELLLAVWVMSGIFPGICAMTEIAFLVVLNVNGLLWARDLIHDPAGMVLKNIAFLILVWACGAIPGGQP